MSKQSSTRTYFLKRYERGDVRAGEGGERLIAKSILKLELAFHCVNITLARGVLLDTRLHSQYISRYIC